MDVVELEPEVELDVKQHHVADSPNEATTKAQTDYRNKRIGPCSADMFNLLWLGTCLFFVIMTFLAAQNVQSQINASSGYTGLGLLYLSYGFAALFASFVIEKFTEKGTIVLCGYSFVAFIAVNIRVIKPLYYIASFTNGAGGAIFWVAQGVYLNRFCTDENRQVFNSIYVAFLASAHFIGNGVTFLFQQAPNFSFAIMFIILAILCAAAITGFLNIRPLPRLANAPKPREFIVQMGGMFSNSDFQFLVPSIFAYGINLTFIFAYFPGKIGSTEWSSAALTLFGLMHMIVSLNARFLGKFLGGYLLLLISAGGLFIGSILATVANDNTRYMYLIAGFFLGTMEAGFLVSFFNITGKDYPPEVQVALNCVFRFYVGIIMAVFFFLGLVLTYNEIFIIMLIVQVFALGMIYLRARLRAKQGKNFVEMKEEDNTITL